MLHLPGVVTHGSSAEVVAKVFAHQTAYPRRQTRAVIVMGGAGKQHVEAWEACDFPGVKVEFPCAVSTERISWKRAYVLSVLQASGHRSATPAQASLGNNACIICDDQESFEFWFPL